MKYKNNISAKLLVAVAVLSLSGCTREIDTDVLATYPNLSEVFIDGFSSDYGYGYQIQRYYIYKSGSACSERPDGQLCGRCFLFFYRQKSFGV